MYHAQSGLGNIYQVSTFFAAGACVWPLPDGWSSKQLNERVHQRLQVALI